MKCCGCFRRPKRKGEDSKADEPDDSPHPREGASHEQKPSAHKSLSTNSGDHTLGKKGSLQSSASVYYDCQDVLDGPGSSRRGNEQGARGQDDANGSPELGGNSPQASQALRKLLAGSLRIGEHRGAVDGIGQYEQADPTGFKVRGKSYMETKGKVGAQGEIYRLIGCDVYKFEQKIHHIAQYIDLPETPQLSAEQRSINGSKKLPTLLVVNIQLPMYKAAMIPGRGSTDGKAAHIVQYFGLPEDFQLDSIGNEGAVDLLLRLVHNDKASNGDKIRDRLKLVARVVNVEEWAQKAPLSGYEHSLLRNYNDKPILTRPQHRFYLEENYLEIDLDVHSYAWAARKALSGFLPRLGSVVFENALIVQGNSQEELPEVVMACARISKLDFTKAKPFPGELHDGKRASDNAVTVEQPLHATTFPDDNISSDARESEESQ